MILVFQNMAVCRAFFNTLLNQRGDIARSCVMLKNFPQVIARDLTPEQQNWVRRNTSDVAVEHQDVQFQPFDH